MPVRAHVAPEPREHEAQAVQQLRHRAEGAAHSGHGGALAQRERGRDVFYALYLRFSGLRHAPPRVGRERFKVAARALRVQYAERERRLARTGDSGDGDELAERHLDVYIFQIMHARAVNFYRARRVCFVSVVMRFHQNSAP